MMWLGWGGGGSRLPCHGQTVMNASPCEVGHKFTSRHVLASRRQQLLMEDQDDGTDGDGGGGGDDVAEGLEEFMIRANGGICI